MDNWIILIIFYLLFAVLYNQIFKLLVNNMIDAGTLLILIELIGGLLSLLLFPFLNFKYSTNPMVYLFLLIACIFYALDYRLSIESRKGIEASVYSIIRQISTIFMILAGIFIFKEKFVLKKIIGAFLIILSNVLIFYEKGIFKFNKSILFAVLSSLCTTIALLIDVNYAKEFNLAIYIFIILIVPALFILFFQKIKMKDLINEYKNTNKIYLFLTSISWPLMMLFKLTAYKIGEVVVIAPLCSLSSIINVVVAYLFLKEKDNLRKKMLAAVIIIFSIFLINN